MIWKQDFIARTITCASINEMELVTIIILIVTQANVTVNIRGNLMKVHEIIIIKKEPDNLEECNSISCNDCIFENEWCKPRRDDWRNSY